MEKKTFNFRDELLACIPPLRAFALSLARRSDQADDLVQQTVLKAWEHQDQFRTGSNLKAWTFTILRNTFLTVRRRRGRDVLSGDEMFAARLARKPEQIAIAHLRDFETALMKLPLGQREVLLLVGAAGFSKEEAAQICGVPQGTIKSRLSRGRAALRGLAPEDTDFGPAATGTDADYLVPRPQ